MKKTISFFLCFSLILTSLTTYASASTYKSDGTILSTLGIPTEIINIMPEEDKLALESSYLNNPDSVDVSTSTLEIDVLSEMNSFVSMTNDELRHLGLSEAQIEEQRAIIDMYNNSTDSQLLDIGLSESEIACLRKALDPNSTYDARNGQISPAKLTYTQTVESLSTSSNVKYNVRIYFNWESPFLCTMYSDKIAIAWGGGLKQTQIDNTVEYYETLSIIKYTNSIGTNDATYSEIAVDAMGLYTIPQTYTYFDSASSTLKAGYIQNGNIEFSLKQTGNTRRESKVISYYAHQVSQFTGSISFTGSMPAPSIQIGTGYDTIYAESDIRY